jgi:hypothetical protein
MVLETVAISPSSSMPHEANGAILIANTFIGGSICGPALTASITSGLVTNEFNQFYNSTIAFENVNWVGTFENGSKGNGTIIGNGIGLIDVDSYEQQRLVSQGRVSLPLPTRLQRIYPIERSWKRIDTDRV